MTDVNLIGNLMLCWEKPGQTANIKKPAEAQYKWDVLLVYYLVVFGTKLGRFHWKQLVISSVL
jgi:hypothetical protein